MTFLRRLVGEGASPQANATSIGTGPAPCLARILVDPDYRAMSQSPSWAERSLSSISHAWSSVWKAECRIRNGSVHDRMRFLTSPAL